MVYHHHHHHHQQPEGHRVRYRVQMDTGAVPMDRLNSVSPAYPFAMSQHPMQHALPQGCGMTMHNYDAPMLSLGEGNVYGGVNTSGSMHGNAYSNGNGGYMTGSMGNDCANGIDSFGSMMMPSLSPSQQQQQQSMSVSVAGSVYASCSSLPPGGMPQRPGQELPPMRGVNNRIASPLSNYNGNHNHSISMNMMNGNMNSSNNMYNGRYQPMARRGFLPVNGVGGYDTSAEMMQAYSQGGNNNNNGNGMTPLGLPSNNISHQTINNNNNNNSCTTITTTTNNNSNNNNTNCGGSSSTSSINSNNNHNNNKGNNNNNGRGATLPGRGTNYHTYAPMGGTGGVMVDPSSAPHASSMGMAGSYMNPSLPPHPYSPVSQQPHPSAMGGGAMQAAWDVTHSSSPSPLAAWNRTWATVQCTDGARTHTRRHRCSPCTHRRLATVHVCHPPHRRACSRHRHRRRIPHRVHRANSSHT